MTKSKKFLMLMLTLMVSVSGYAQTEIDGLHYNLDSKTKEELHRLFFELRDRFGITIVIVTHDKDLAAMSDRVVEIRDGQIL